LNLGVVEWRKAYDEHEKLNKKAILFVMTDDTKNCDDVAEYLEGTYPELKNAVLVVDQFPPTQASGLEDTARSIFRGERCTYGLNSGPMQGRVPKFICFHGNRHA
jgi:hypothetical protein